MQHWPQPNELTLSSINKMTKEELINWVEHLTSSLKEEKASRTVETSDNFVSRDHIPRFYSLELALSLAFHSLNYWVYGWIPPLKRSSRGIGACSCWEVLRQYPLRPCGCSSAEMHMQGRRPFCPPCTPSMQDARRTS